MITKTLLDFYLEQLSNYTSTDKGTAHDYINAYYNTLLTPFQFEDIKLLEIGYSYGSSAYLWRNYFINAEVWMLDCNKPEEDKVAPGVNYIWEDAYTQSTLDKFQDGYFDFIIDDGPHTIESQIYTVRNWTRKLKSGGKLIVEDIQDITATDILSTEAEKIGENSRIYDLRANKNQYDDIIFEIVKK